MSNFNIDSIFKYTFNGYEDTTVKLLSINLFAIVNLVKYEFKFEEKNDYIYLKLKIVKHNNMSTNYIGKESDFKTFSVHNYSNNAKLDLKLGNRKPSTISFTLYDLDRYEGIWNDLYNTNTSKPMSSTIGINLLEHSQGRIPKNQRDRFTKCVLYAQLYNEAKAKTPSTPLNKSITLSTINNTLKTLKNNNTSSNRSNNIQLNNLSHLDLTKLSKLSNEDMKGGNKAYIKLQSGGKRLVRYGPKGGKYYTRYLCFV